MFEVIEYSAAKVPVTSRPFPNEQDKKSLNMGYLLFRHSPVWGFLLGGVGAVINIKPCLIIEGSR